MVTAVGVHAVARTGGRGCGDILEEGHILLGGEHGLHLVQIVDTAAAVAAGGGAVTLLAGAALLAYLGELLLLGVGKV